MDLDEMMGMDLFWGGNYTIIDGPLKRTYDSVIEDSYTYKFQERLVSKEANNIDGNLPEYIVGMVKRSISHVGTYQEWFSFDGLFNGPDIRLLTALVQRHVLAHALQEYYIIEAIRDYNHQESLDHQAWNNPGYNCEYAFGVPRHTLCYVDPVRYATIYKHEWMKDYTPIYYQDKELFELSLKVSSLERLAYSYDSSSSSKMLVDYYLFNQHSFRLTVKEIEEIISKHMILCDNEQRKMAIMMSNIKRHRKSKVTHVLRYNKGEITYSTIPKVPSKMLKAINI